MIPVVVAVEPLAEFKLRLEFDDGTRGVVDLTELVTFTGVFEPLHDSAEFRRVSVDEELGTVAWPNGADLDPLMLYASVCGVPVENSSKKSPASS